MTEERVAPWIVRQIESNLWAILASIFAAFAAYVIGTTTTDSRLTALEQANTKSAAAVEKLDSRADDLTSRIDRLEVQTQLEREERMKGDSK